MCSLFARAAGVLFRAQKDSKRYRTVIRLVRARNAHCLPCHRRALAKTLGSSRPRRWCCDEAVLREREREREMASPRSSLLLLPLRSHFRSFIRRQFSTMGSILGMGYVNPRAVSVSPISVHFCGPLPALPSRCGPCRHPNRLAILTTCPCTRGRADRPTRRRSQSRSESPLFASFSRSPTPDGPTHQEPPPRYQRGRGPSPARQVRPEAR